MIEHMIGTITVSGGTANKEQRDIIHADAQLILIRFAKDLQNETFHFDGRSRLGLGQLVKRKKQRNDKQSISVNLSFI